MKIQTLASMVSSTCVLWCFLPMAVYGCSIHDQLCTFHALGAPHTSYDVKNASTSLNIYAQAGSPSAGAARTDFDNNVLLPTNTAISDAISPTVIRPTGPYTAAQTSYLQNGHLPAIWSDSSTLPVHVYPSQYQVTFNQNTAQANHTGDLNGGENGNIPNAMGCPSRESNPDCEAVVITGNVPSGIYSQKIEMFNFYNVSNPSAVMTVGAYATGQGVLIQQSHVDDATAQLGGLPRQLVDLQFTNGKPSNVTSAVNSSFYLAGSKATSQQFDYHFYNRGFDSHAQGTLSFDQKMYHNRGMSQAHQEANHQTGNIDIYRNSLYSIDTKTTTIGAQGGSVVSVRNGVVRAGQAQLVGVQRLQPPAILDNGLCYVDDRLNAKLEASNPNARTVLQTEENTELLGYYKTYRHTLSDGTVITDKIKNNDFNAETGLRQLLVDYSPPVIAMNQAQILMTGVDYNGDISSKAAVLQNLAEDMVFKKVKIVGDFGSAIVSTVKKEIPYIKKEADYIVNWKGLTSKQKGAVGETKEAVDIILNNPNLEFFDRQVRLGKDELGNNLTKDFTVLDFLYKNKGDDFVAVEAKTGYPKRVSFPLTSPQRENLTRENLTTSDLHNPIPYPSTPIDAYGTWRK